MKKNWKSSLFIALALSTAALGTTPAYSDVSTISQSIQGAESNVKGNIQDVNARALSVFKEQNIAEIASSSKQSEDRPGVQSLTLSGKKGDLTVEIQLDYASKNQTHVGVIAKHGTLNWSKDYASSILDKIVEKG